MSINEVYKTIQYIVRKNTTGGLLTPDQFNLIMNRAQMTKFMRSYGNPQEYQPGQPIPKIAFEVTQAITDELSVFLVNSNQILDSNGRFTYPDDYVHTIPGMYYRAAVNNFNGTTSSTKIVPIEIVDKQMESYRLSSNIVYPTPLTPIAIEEANFIQFYPKVLGPIQFSYLRQPAECKWAYTVVDDAPVFDPLKSVDLEWRDIDINSIIVTAVSYIGISIKDQDVAQYAEIKQQQGV